MSTADERPVHVRRAEALRKLADLIENDPAFDELVVFPLTYFHSPLNARDDARADLQLYVKTLTEAGAVVEIDNTPDRCEVRVDLGPLQMKAWAFAHQLAVDAPPPPPKYEPITQGLTS
ncbi:hypothetical protein [Amycolatopsis vancoresmycina]|uniref:hypothetical protein n=1 Tax=Amycolatopsis vancoresmycina TaxID=208444 RepID=UPI00138E2FE2|nr:hypothetical protein [Amycolatopsis vancoresmycina]